MKAVQFFCRSKNPPVEIWINPAFVVMFTASTNERPEAKCCIQMQSGGAFANNRYIYVHQTPAQVAQMLMLEGT